MKSRDVIDDESLEALISQLLAKKEAPPAYKKRLAEFRKTWAGRTFRCNTTGVEFTIPEDVYYRQFFAFGESYIDLGDGYYWRVGGDIEEIKEEEGGV